MEKVGILTIGQTPPPDLEAVFRRHLPGVELIVRGALDGLSRQAIQEMAAAGGEYPLFTILREATLKCVETATAFPQPWQDNPWPFALGWMGCCVFNRQKQWWPAIS